MRAFLEEYGKAITTVIFSIFIFALSVPLIFGMTDTLYPQDSIQEIEMDINETAYNQPVILVDSGMRVSQGDQDYNGKATAGNEAEFERVKDNFLCLAKAYDKSHEVAVTSDGTADPSTPCLDESDRIDDKMDIFGVETVDTTKKGVYRIAYYVKNNAGHSFICNVSVVVS